LVSPKADARTAISANGSALLLAASAAFTVAIAICIAMSPELLRDGNLSEFGVGDETFRIFNGTLILVGVCHLLVARSWSGGWAWIAAALCVVGGASMIGAGVVNVAIDKEVHLVFAVIDYLGHLLLPVFLARSLGTSMRAVSYGAVAASIVFLVLWGIMPAFLSESIGQGGVQVLATLPLALWMMAFAGHALLAQASRAPARGGRPVKPDRPALRSGGPREPIQTA
jgi:hypothetical protein